ncbi:hypothetical protein L4D00_18940 [Photobacterium swingsii]|uniref:hypothetical protein n=1 Tax=Photobacterium swingsii TaxID=680026 RepID=UPI003D1351B7
MMNKYKQSSQPQILLRDTLRLPTRPSRFSIPAADKNFEHNQHLANWKHLASVLSQKVDDNQVESDKNKSVPKSDEQQADTENTQLQEEERFLQEVLRSLRKLNGKVQIK